MYPFYRVVSQIWIERTFYSLFPIWRLWFQRQNWPDCNVVHAIMGYGTEPFARAGKNTLKVLDCQNSHPTSYYGFWQRECDLWCPGEKVPIPQWMFSRMNREVQRADVLLCPSEFVQDTMVRNGAAPEKCLISPFGVDTSNFKPRSEIPKSPRFISVGTICVRKGHQYLFRAFEMVQKQLPGAELICVGQYKSDFRKERPNWEGRFTHYPSLNHEQLAKLLGTCTAFVMTSVEEGFARVIPESMAAGLPVIASYETGATTLVRDGVEGFIVPATNPERIAAAMLAVANDHALCERMGRAAYARGAVQNTWQDYGDRLLAEYANRLKVLSG
jgi:glycosyltransferase involved in cell wall biosynthesis